MKKSREQFFDLVVYEIYIRSFSDSNGDGVGDIRGVIDRLDHLVELGVNAIWLCPCFESPNEDNGYDISDYRKIGKEYGSLSDMEELIECVHALGIKLFLDLVVNHTSKEHPWFLESKKDKTNPYRNYYYWSEKPEPKWKAIVGGSAWEYDKGTREYYLHSFSAAQPDLNWTNAAVREEIRKVVEFWTEKGVDGFRCDMLDFIAKDFKTGKMYGCEPMHGYLRTLFDGFDESFFTVGECQVDEKSIGKLCGEERGELTCSFQFEHLGIGRKDKFESGKFSFDELKDVLVKWQILSEKNEFLYTLFTDNHDQPYMLSRLKTDGEFRYEAATMYATTFFLLRGIPFLYQGQEYGAVNPRYERIEDFDDLETKRFYEEKKGKIPEKELLERINFGSRDNARRPFAWTGEPPFFGFSDGGSWITPHSFAEEINLERDKNSDRSVFRFYKSLLRLRKENEAFRKGSFRDLTVGRGYFAYERKYERSEFLVVCNFDKERKIGLVDGERKLVLKNYPDRKSAENIFRPFEIAVFKKETNTD